MAKFAHSIPRYLLLLLLSCSFGLWTSAWAADGLVVDFSGDVRVNGQPVSAKSKVNKGDKITTGSGSSVTIVLSDKSVLDIKANSEIDLSDYVYDKPDHSEDTSEVGLVEGTLRYVSGLMGKSDSEKIRFRAGTSTIGVRGSYTTITFDGIKITADASIGFVIVTFPSGSHCIAPTRQSCVGSLQTGSATPIPTPVPDAVNRAAALVAASDPDNPEDVAASQAAIRELGNIENLALLIAVLSNNSEQLQIGARVIAQTIINIAKVFPDLLDEMVFTAVLLNPDNAEIILETVVEAFPEADEQITEAAKAAEETINELEEDVTTGEETQGLTTEPQQETPPRALGGGGSNLPVCTSCDTPTPPGCTGC